MATDNWINPHTRIEKASERILCCGCPRVRPMHKSQHSSKSYCECSTNQARELKTEENTPTRKNRNYYKYHRARHVFYSRNGGNTMSAHST